MLALASPELDVRAIIITFGESAVSQRVYTGYARDHDLTTYVGNTDVDAA